MSKAWLAVGAAALILSGYHIGRASGLRDSGAHAEIQRDRERAAREWADSAMSGPGPAEDACSAMINIAGDYLREIEADK